MAEALADLHRHPRQVTPFTDRFTDLDEAAAYAASAGLHAYRQQADGWRPVGRKIGFTNRTLWPRYGVRAPMWGFVYETTLAEADAVSLQGLVQPRIEPEVCFGLAERPPAGADADPVRLLGSIAWVAHALEVVHCYHPEWRFRLPDCIAANGLHGRLVIGERVPVASIPDLAERLATVEVVLRRGDAEVDRGVGANVLGSPLLALAHLARVLEGQPDAPPLAPGEVVTTGVITDAHPVAPGETWSTEVRGLPLPGLRVAFA